MSYKQLKKLLYRNSKVAATKCVRQLVAIAAELAQSDDVVPQSKGATGRGSGGMRADLTEMNYAACG